MPQILLMNDSFHKSSMSLKTPEVIELSSDAMNALIERAEQKRFSDSDYQLIVKVLKFSIWLQFMLEEAGKGTIYYPGNYERDIQLQNQKQGLQQCSLTTYPGLLDFVLSTEYTQWATEIQKVFAEPR